MRSLVLIFGMLVACGAKSTLEDPLAEGGLGDGGGGGEGGAGDSEHIYSVYWLALGAAHSCLVSEPGSVYCWGSNSSGQLGTGDTEDALVPKRIELPSPATFIAAGSYHTCATLDNGRAYCWGRNTNGELGIGEVSEFVASPTEVAFVPEIETQSLALGEEHSCAVGHDTLQDTYNLYCWGSNASHQIGTSTSIPGAVFGGVSRVTAGAFHTCFLDLTNVPWCIGDNAQLQCGVEVASPIATPQVPALPTLTPAMGITSGRGYHTCLYRYEAGIRCWGDNESGQLGVPPFDAGTPVDTQTLGIPGGGDASAGFAHTCGVSAGGVRCWGDNSSGQLGTSDPSHYNPTLVPGLKNIEDVEAGALHTCASNDDGEVYCWGNNDFGQLGDGTTITSFAPVQAVLP